jgi:hypothetical protein
LVASNRQTITQSNDIMTLYKWFLGNILKLTFEEKPHQEAISQTRSKNMVALRPLSKETCLSKLATYEQENFTKQQYVVQP